MDTQATVATVIATLSLIAHAIRPIAKAPLAGSQHPTEKDPMSTTVSVPSTSSYGVETIANAIHEGAAWALKGLATMGSDWAAIKANPLYGSLATAAATMATNEMAANGVPVAPLVNVGSAIASMLDALAAAHPAISTP